MALDPEIIAAARKYGPSVDAIAKQYGISGAALLAKLTQGESGGRKNAVSSAGARSYTQFMPGSRQIAIDKYGVDPWADADQAIHGAALHLLGKINGSTGLKGYNPGSPTYTKYILDQRVGNVSGGHVSSPSAPGNTAPAAVGPSGSGQPAAPGFTDPGATGDFTGLLGSLLAKPEPVVQQTPVAPPSFSARAPVPQGFQAPTPEAPMAPAQQDGVSGALSLLESLRGTDPASTASGAGASADAPQETVVTSVMRQRAAAKQGGGGYPLGVAGKVIGTPHSGTHTLGNWQSDNAVDIGVPEGTPMLALQDGVVVKVTKHPQGSGRFAGDQITIRGANGNEYFYAHGIAGVKAGQKIAKGQELGVTGSANGVAHLHFGQLRGDPRRHSVVKRT